MSSLILVPRYGRWSEKFPLESGIEKVHLVSPSGKESWRPIFEHHPVVFHYDLHGYEIMEADGKAVLMVRFTPNEIGEYRYETIRQDQVIDRGSFNCVSSDHPGYVKISSKDPRYFCFSNGDSYCAVGLNLCSPVFYPLPLGMEHFSKGDQKATIGLREYERWFRVLSENGGNFARIWLSNAYLQAETTVAGQVNPQIFCRLDGIIELARRFNIRLKLCFDHFRAFQSANKVTQAFFLRQLSDPETARQPASMDEWLVDPTWQDGWFRKVRAYLDRYSGDPVVMAWELWNEMDCVEASRWELVREWTRKMLTRIKQAAPDHLVVNSLGSFDDERKIPIYQDLVKMEEMDFQQVHRYLDQGAPWDICRRDPVAFSIDAIQKVRRLDRPILLSETGAVNDRHTGEFRYFRMDNQGLIFHDTTFPAFFAGSAGTGHIWFWDRYVDQKNLWRQFRPFAELLDGVVLDGEGFEIVDFTTDVVWCLALVGKTTILLWVRNRADTWENVLRDDVSPQPLDCSIDLNVKIDRAKFFSTWVDDIEKVQIHVNDSQIQINHLQHGGMVRLRIQSTEGELSR